MASTSNNKARTALWVSIGLTMALYWLPLGSTLAYPLILLSTLAHELGHGIAAMMVGNDFDAFVLYSDGSGAAMTSGNPGRLASAFISAGGLVGPSIAAAGCFWAGRRGKIARPALLVFGALLLVAMVLKGGKQAKQCFHVVQYNKRFVVKLNVCSLLYAIRRF